MTSPPTSVSRQAGELMTRQWKKLLFEMAIIILVAVTIGIVWNHRMLMDIYSGKAVESASEPAPSREPSAGLVPTGLMQAREMFNGKDAVFIDAREGSAYRQGHIKGAFSLPVGEFEARLAEFQAKVPPDSTLVIYCSGFGCHDSKIVGEKLLQSGYGQILIFEGGFPEWKDAGLPVEGPQS